jgi:hypothetical protein
VNTWQNFGIHLHLDNSRQCRPSTLLELISFVMHGQEDLPGVIFDEAKTGYTFRVLMYNKD